MKRWCTPLLLLLALAVSASAQTQPDNRNALKPRVPESPAGDYKNFVADQFGDSFTFEPITPEKPVLLTDLDGDGREDIVLQAHSKSPLDDAADMHYRVIDPFDTYWGWGDPNDTSSFTAEARNHDRVLL